VPEHDAAPTALARRLLAEGNRAEAEQVVARLVTRQFGIAIRSATIHADWTSLNSLNGRIETDDGRRYFFKFHQEEDEEATVREYYRAEILGKAGLPVDMPVHISRQPGQQVLLYAFRHDRSLADLCLELERGQDDRVEAEVEALQADLDRLTGRIYAQTLHASDTTRSSAEAVHQLFHHRLYTAPDAHALAGRVARYYAGAQVCLPGGALAWDEFKHLRWRINGVPYRYSLDELFHESLERLAPSRLAASGAVTAHGDAHNANVWVERRDGMSRLVLFDPAFAGEHVPALLADVKATFHNVFAHPLWLYHPAEAAARYRVDVSVGDGAIAIAHDWAPTPLRRAFLRAKVEHVWRPLVAALRASDLLPRDWTRIVRCALFCCPTLVMNLRADAPHGATPGRSPAISALSFAIAVMAGSEPASEATDPFTAFLAAIAPQTGA
jgi:hypothetical protein